MDPAPESTEERITRLHGHGMVDLHFDLPMFLYDNRDRKNVLASDFLPEFEAGDIGTAAAGIYIEDQYIPDKALEVALGQVARLYVEVERCDRFTICRSYAEIKNAREQGKIGLLITMEGAEPIGTDLNLLYIFYELGLRVIGLTHARSNAIGSDCENPRSGIFSRLDAICCFLLPLLIDDAISQQPDTRHFNLDNITRTQVPGWIHPRTCSARCAGQNDIAALERAER